MPALRLTLAAAAIAALASFPAATAFAAASTSPGTGPATASGATAENAAEEGGAKDAAPDVRAGTTDSAEDELADAIQQAKLEAFRLAVENRDLAAVEAQDALDAANLAAQEAAAAEEAVRTAREKSAAAELAASLAELDAARTGLVVDGFARQLASSGGGGEEVLVALVVSGEPPAEVLRAVESSSRAASALTDALRAQVVATDKATAASEAAAQAEAAVAAKMDAAEKRAREAAELLVAARSRLSTSEDTLGAVMDQEFSGLEDLVVDVPATADCLPAAAALVYPNGMLPSAVLCPLASAPYHALRSDAARGYDRMAAAFEREFGVPLCITDSYRSLTAQIDLKKRKPTLAAVPGTSDHGWGIAVDLCGGVENFGTPEHDWLRANAGLFGWFHPGWAQADGSKPEPWHWEFSPQLAEQMQTVLDRVAAERSRGGRDKGPEQGDRASRRLTGATRPVTGSLPAASPGTPGTPGALP